MPTLDWLDREQAMRRADEVPYRLVECFGGFGKPSPSIQEESDSKSI